MLLVCSTYVSVMCMYCVLFDLRRKLNVTKSSEERKLRRKKASFATELSLLRTNKTRNDELHKDYASFHSINGDKLYNNAYVVFIVKFVLVSSIAISTHGALCMGPD